jgi:hypothetical protein
MRRSPLLCFLLMLFASPIVGRADDNVDHFEKHIRPLLVTKCVECHSGRTPDGNLDLSTRSGFAAGGMSGRLVDGPGVGSSSLFERLIATDDGLRMPPDEPLTKQEIAAVQQWIENDAVWPDANDSIMPGDMENPVDSHWAFQPVTRPTVPVVADSTWCWTDIDRFIRAKQEAAGVEPVEDVANLAWLRRATLDLTGLPPTLEELIQYSSAASDHARLHEINRLLGSRAYAERQARRWLDLARYADTSGDGTDTPIPEARYYRDWVIDAFDLDMPYDQFIIEQLAGDILAKQNPDGPDAYRQIIATGYIALSRRFGNSKFAELHQIIDDSIDTMGRSMLGLSLGCARCHHHKFDPVTTEDYYGLYGYFASTQYPHAGTEHQKERSDLPEIRIPDQLAEVMESRVAWAVCDKPEVGDARIHVAGDPHRKGPVAPRGYLAFLNSARPDITTETSGRLQLAQWIASKDNPLTARVMVNRVWQSHFGRGLVPTASNFGMQAPEPLHVDLLNYLASEFVAQGWSIKHLHQMIMSSHVYYLAGSEESAQLAVDEANELLWHFPRQRMDAETFRDAILAVSGRLQVGSSGRHPFKPTEKIQYNQGNPFSEIFDHEYRSIYLMTPRLNRHPMMALFDGADANVSTPQRGESTVPLQSLFMVNGAFVSEQAAAFASRICEGNAELESRVARAWQIAYARPHTSEELFAVGNYINSYAAKRIDAGSDASEAEHQAWSSLARAILSSNEFMYID